MRVAADGLPIVGESGRYLDARPDLPEQPRDGDMPVSGGMVRPGTGGMSVSPPPVTNLPLHRRPKEYGGRSKDTVFDLDTHQLPEELRYRADPGGSRAARVRGTLTSYALRRISEGIVRYSRPVDVRGII
jgi:hypothetical protein